MINNNSESLDYKTLIERLKLLFKSPSNIPVILDPEEDFIIIDQVYDLLARMIISDNLEHFKSILSEPPSRIRSEILEHPIIADLLQSGIYHKMMTKFKIDFRLEYGVDLKIRKI